MSSTYEKNKALLYIYSGAGGVDAQDWASMLLRMYQRYGQKNGWNFVILHESLGEQKGIKNAVVEITAKNSDIYNKLKGEAGVHRLVRISPFSSKSLRHTSFALVEILPVIVAHDFKIDHKDLKIDTFRSSGPGGQNVNKLETAVRITHVPTGVSVAVQSERSQVQNKDKAMQLLYSKLAQKLEQAKIKELSELKPEMKSGSIEWGSQIRSYVLHPYQMVKDHRTGVKSSQPDKVLEGDLDKFIETEQQS
jgi:peptide chain release factor 2